MEIVLFNQEMDISLKCKSFTNSNLKELFPVQHHP